MRKVVLLVVLIVIAITLSGCSSSSYSSGSDYRSPQQSYDDKYGAGEYQKDKDMMDSIRKSWPGN
jgi:uncharacterized protein YceK